MCDKFFQLTQLEDSGISIQPNWCSLNPEKRFNKASAFHIKVEFGSVKYQLLSSQYESFMTYMNNHVQLWHPP